MTRQQSKRKRTKVTASAPTCLNPDKAKHSLRVAQRIAAKQDSYVYPCGNHYHVTRKSMEAL